MSNLDHDIREAARLGYGVHYGDYMADRMAGSIHVPPVPEEDEGPLDNARQCSECGAWFVPRVHNQLCCCDSCAHIRRDRTANMRYHAKVAAAKKEEVEC